MLDVGAVKHIEDSDLEVTAIEVTLMASEGTGIVLLVREAAAHVVVGHLNDRGLIGEKDGAVFGVVSHVPDTSGGTEEDLIAVQIKFRGKVFDWIDWINAGVLVQRAGGVDGIGAEFGCGEPVANRIEIVGVSVSADDGVGDFRANVVAEGVRLDWCLVGTEEGSILKTSEAIIREIALNQALGGVGMDDQREQVAVLLITEVSCHTVGHGQRFLEVRAFEIAVGESTADAVNGDLI